MENKRNFIKGICCGLLIPLCIIGVLALFNVGNLGSLFQSVYLLQSKSLTSLSADEKVEGAISGMVDALDDEYSYYLDAKEFNSLMEEVSGSYMGIGVYLSKDKNAEYVTIIAPIKNTPAFEAGLKAGDEVISVNGESMKGVSADVVSNTVKNSEAKEVTLEIRREGETKEYTVARTDINIPTVEGEYLEDGIAYISISQFNDKTPQDLSSVLGELQSSGTIKGILLDVRNNPGGSVPAVEQVAETFLEKGKTVLWIEEKDKESSYESTNTNPLNVPVVMLVNENSASASEILSAALQDNGVATLVGSTTYGKGIIQTVYSLKDGGAVKITTARYLSPNRNEIHKVGVKPDVEVALDGDKTDIIYSKDIEKDPQLKKAMEVLQEKLQ